MDIMMKSRMIPLELENGEIVQLTLNFGKLLNVRAKRKDVYDRYNNIMMNGSKDILDSATVVYVAYLCGLENMEDAMSEEEFMTLLPPYTNVTINLFVELTRPKKQTDSEERSKESEPNDHE